MLSTKLRCAARYACVLQPAKVSGKPHYICTVVWSLTIMLLEIVAKTASARQARLERVD